MILILNDKYITAVCFGYETNATYENETGLLKIITDENGGFYYDGTGTEYTFIENVELPTDFYELPLNEYYIYDNGFIKITE